MQTRRDIRVNHLAKLQHNRSLCFFNHEQRVARDQQKQKECADDYKVLHGLPPLPLSRRVRSTELAVEGPGR